MIGGVGDSGAQGNIVSGAKAEVAAVEDVSDAGMVADSESMAIGGIVDDIEMDMESGVQEAGDGFGKLSERIVEDDDGGGQVVHGIGCYESEPGTGILIMDLELKVKLQKWRSLVPHALRHDALPKDGSA